MEAPCERDAVDVFLSFDIADPSTVKLLDDITAWREQYDILSIAAKEKIAEVLAPREAVAFVFHSNVLEQVGTQCAKETMTLCKIALQDAGISALSKKEAETLGTLRALQAVYEERKRQEADVASGSPSSTPAGSELL